MDRLKQVFSLLNNCISHSKLNWNWFFWGGVVVNSIAMHSDGIGESVWFQLTVLQACVLNLPGQLLDSMEFSELNVVFWGFLLLTSCVELIATL